MHNEKNHVLTFFFYIFSPKAKTFFRYFTVRNKHLISLSALLSSGEITDGLVPLTAVSRTDLSQHSPLSASVALPWRCEALEGTVQVKTTISNMPAITVSFLHFNPDTMASNCVSPLELLRFERHFAG